MRRKLWMVGAALLVAGLGLGTVGQVGTSVLDIAPGVGQIGAGGAGVAVVRGAETIYYNPAGLAGLPGISFSSFYSSHMGVATLSSLALAMRGVGVAVELYNAGAIDGYDAQGNPTEDLAYSSTAYLFGFGLDPSMFPFMPQLPLSFSLGAALKGISNRVGDQRGGGFTFDLGLRVGVPPMSLGPVAISDAAVGVTLSNLFGGLSYDGTEDDLPVSFGVGVSARLLGVILLATDVHMPGGFAIGVTYEPVPTLAVRIGLLSKGEISITFGLGLDVQGFLIDYAFVSHAVGPTHRIGLTLDFSALDISALMSSLRRILP